MLVYLTLCHYPGQGHAWRETEPSYSRVELITDLLSGEIEHPLQILELDPGARLTGDMIWCRDVTDEVLREVARLRAHEAE